MATSQSHCLSCVVQGEDHIWSFDERSATGVPDYYQDNDQTDLLFTLQESTLGSNSPLNHHWAKMDSSK